MNMRSVLLSGVSFIIIAAVFYAYLVGPQKDLPCDNWDIATLDVSLVPCSDDCQGALSGYLRTHPSERIVSVQPTGHDMLVIHSDKRGPLARDLIVEEQCEHLTDCLHSLQRTSDVGLWASDGTRLLRLRLRYQPSEPHRKNRWDEAQCGGH